MSSSLETGANETLLFLSTSSMLVLVSAPIRPLITDSPTFMPGGRRSVEGNFPPSKLYPANTYHILIMKYYCIVGKYRTMVVFQEILYYFLREKFWSTCIMSSASIPVVKCDPPASASARAAFSNAAWLAAS